jgi:hypothetical protein
MFLWPVFLLDACPDQLLKLHNNNNLGFFRKKISAKTRLDVSYVSGADGISLLKSTFARNRMLLNPHSAKCSAMNPRYVQPGDDTELVVS